MSLVGLVSVLEKEIETHVPILVMNLEQIDIRYDVATTTGVEMGMGSRWPVAYAKDINHMPLKTGDLLGGRSGAVQGRWRSARASAAQHFLGMNSCLFTSLPRGPIK